MDDTMKYDFEIKADMTLTDYLSSDLVAVGTVTIENFFAIHNVKVLSLGKEGEKKLRVVLPNRQNPKTGKWEDVFTIPANIQKQIEKAVTRDVSIKLGSLGSWVKDYLEVDVFLSRKEYWPTVGYATVKLEGAFEVNKVRIVDDQRGGLEVKYPYTKSGTGKYIKLFGGICEEHEQSMDHTIICKFNDVYMKERGEYYVPKQFPQEMSGPESTPENTRAAVNQNYEATRGGVRL